jgi:hypothetical protein
VVSKVKKVLQWQKFFAVLFKKKVRESEILRLLSGWQDYLFYAMILYLSLLLKALRNTPVFLCYLFKQVLRSKLLSLH